MQSLTLEQLQERYGTATERRVELYEQFSAWLNAAFATHMLQRVWIFGSFASMKPGPGDLDIFALFESDFNTDAIPNASRHWFDHELCKSIHEIDFFWVTSKLSSETFDFVLETFRYDRAGNECIVEVLL